MPDRIEVNNEITVGAQPSEAELKAMADEGYRSVISLRTDEEKMQELSPEEEGKRAMKFGLQYVNIPVSMEEADKQLVDRFRENLERMPKPVFVHCRMGKRAGAFTMMDQAVKKDMSGEKTIKKAEDMGFECDEDALADFVKNYVNSRT
ncbi:MAG: fused DSP-PTPase phosphatase/NAD kinase-like protein [Phycisphaerae bacterium]